MRARAHIHPRPNVHSIAKVDKQEFLNYYERISASVDLDDYFELMMRNAWHITGGEGWCANTANKRVLVTHADGTQSVEEVNNDLGLKADDKAGMMRRLKAQGIDATGISTDGAVDDEDENGQVSLEHSRSRTHLLLHSLKQCCTHM